MNNIFNTRVLPCSSYIVSHKHLDGLHMKKNLHKDIDALVVLTNKYRRRSIFHIVHIRFLKLLLLISKKILRLLKYIATPTFIALGILYQRHGDVFTHHIEDTLVEANLINLISNYSNHYFSLYPSDYKTDNYSIFEVPCDQLEYTNECPQADVSHYVKTHNAFTLSVFQKDLTHYYLNQLSKTKTLCLLPSSTSIIGSYPVPLEVAHDKLPFLETSLWCLVAAVIALVAFIEDMLYSKHRFANTWIYISRCQLSTTLSLLKKYIDNPGMDKDYTYLLLQTLMSHADHTIIARSSTERLMKCLSPYNPIKTKCEKLNRFITKEKTKLSKLLSLKEIINKELYQPTLGNKGIIALMLIAIDMSFFLSRCNPLWRSCISILHLTFLHTFPRGEFMDESTINTTVEFPCISSAYPIIDKFSDTTQRALIFRLAIECIYTEILPIRKSSTMERVIMTTNRLYNGSALKSLLSILDTNPC